MDNSSKQDTPEDPKRASFDSTQTSTDIKALDDHKNHARSRWILAFFVLLGVVAAAVIEGQFTSIGFTATKFEAPFFYTLLRCIARALAFPIMLTFKLLKAAITRDKSFQASQFLSHCVRLAPGRELTVRNFLKYYTLPTLTSLTTGVGYMVALKFVAPSVTAACFCCCVALSYILTILLLDGKHVIIKTLFVLVSFGGVTLVAYETSSGASFRSDAYIGIICVLVACASLSFHQFFFTKSFPNADSNQCAFAVTLMFAVCALVYWPVPVILRVTGMEIWEWSDIPGGFMAGALLSTLSYAFLYAFGLSISTPFFMSLSELVILSASAVVDHLRGVPIGPLQIAGSATIGLAFLVLVIPEQYLSLNLRRRSPRTFDLYSSHQEFAAKPKEALKF